MSEIARPRWTVPLADTSFGEEEIEAVTRVLRSGWITAGPETDRFEKEFAARVGVRYAIALGSGTAALHLANVAVGLGPGDEVICPALTFVATANASRYTGADVVFADVVGPQDLTVSAEDIERKLSPRTRAISVVHYGGFACDMDPILEIAARNGLTIIEDCAHAPLARHVSRDGTRRVVGTLGAIGCFSFFGNKNMTTGEGGMATTNDEAVAEQLRRYRSHGMSTASYDRFRGHAQDYDVSALGFNYRIDDLRSAIGRVQLARLDDLHAKRRRIFRWYLEELDGVADVTVPFADRDLEQATPHILCIVMSGNAPPRLQRLHDAGIQTSKHYDLVSTFSIYRDARGATPIAAGLQLATLPLTPKLTRDTVRRIASLLRDD